MRLFPYTLVAVLSAALVSSCSTANSSDSAAVATAPEADFTDDGVSISLPSAALHVPLIRQRRDYTCGDVALLSILKYWKPDTFKNTTEADLIAPLGTTSCDGTEPKSIAAFVEKQPGLAAEVRTDLTTDDLDRALARGEPAIVDIEAWQDQPHIADFAPWESDYADGHYVVLIGAGKATLPPPDARRPGHPPVKTPTSEQDVYFFMDPSTTGNYTYIPKSELVARWHDVVPDGTGQQLHTQHLAIFVSNTGGLAPAPVTPRTRTATPID